MALLLMNNADESGGLNINLSHVPGLGPKTSCVFFDVWHRQSLGLHGPDFKSAVVASRDSVFVTLSQCSDQ